MNRGGGYHATQRGRRQQQQSYSWRPHHHHTPNSSLHPPTRVGDDVASDGRMPGSSDRKPHGTWKGMGRGSGGKVPMDNENRTPEGGFGQRERSAFGGHGYTRGGRVKHERASSEAGNGSDYGRYSTIRPSSAELKSGPNSGQNPVDEIVKPLSEGASESSMNLDQSFIKNVDYVLDVPHSSEESSYKNSHTEVKQLESAKNVCDSKDSEFSKPPEGFDICPPKPSSGFVLKPSLLSKNREKRNDMKRTIAGLNGTILKPGMIFLKSYLSSTEQAEILKSCRKHGMGQAGFYQPCFHDGGKMHLKLMCFGQFWDPETNKYGEVRPMDGAKPPSVPLEFLQLVDRAIRDAHSLIAQDSRVKNVEDVLPPVKPDICLVNYYSNTGRLGLHQDKDESQESLDKGIPIVSFSIGDSAEFLYGDQREVEKAQKIILESGDVLIFGGKSRHIFHGVSTILPDTAPKSLLEKTNFRPGRLNLTFRQHL